MAHAHSCCCGVLEALDGEAFLNETADGAGDGGLLAMNRTASERKALPPPKVRPEFQEYYSEMVQLRRMLHSWPELGFQETRTADFLAEQLRKLPGVEVVTGLGVTGLIGIYRGAKAGPTIAFRADMDGLPVNERAEGNKSENWISKNSGVMHACGHDGHVTMLLFFARAVVAKYPPSEISGTIVFLFQPAEEGGGGAKKMLDDNLLKAGSLKDIDAFYGIHLISAIPLGMVASKPGPLMAGVDTLDIDVKGVGGHGAMPHQTVDSILVATQLVAQLHSILSRNVDPMETGVLTVGKIQAGTASNVIADDARLEGTIRYFNEEVREKIHHRIRTLCAGLSQAYECKITPTIKGNYPCTVNHAKEAEIALNAAQKVVGTGASLLTKGMMGSEDFSFFLNVRPGAFMFVGAAPDNTRLAAYPHHSPLFDFHEDALMIGASVWMQLFEDLLITKTASASAGTSIRL